MLPWLSAHLCGRTMRHSKLQKQVLALYRQFLQAGREKPGFVPRIREEFRVNARIKRTDVMHIEYLYRRGQRQLEQLRDVNTKQLGSFSKPTENSWFLFLFFFISSTSCSNKVFRFSETNKRRCPESVMWLCFWSCIIIIIIYYTYILHIFFWAKIVHDYCQIDWLCVVVNKSASLCLFDLLFLITNFHVYL